MQAQDAKGPAVAVTAGLIGTPEGAFSAPDFPRSLLCADYGQIEGGDRLEIPKTGSGAAVPRPLPQHSGL